MTKGLSKIIYFSLTKSILELHHKLTISLYSIHATPRGPSEQQRSYRDTMAQAQRQLTLLQELCDMGSAMRTVMTRCLVSPAHYQLLLQPTTSYDAEHASFMQRSTARYSEALASLPSPQPWVSGSPAYQSCKKNYVN